MQSNGTWPARTATETPAPDAKASLTVFAPGSLVIAGTVTAKVVCACVYEGLRVRYDVVWWTGDTRHEVWVEAFEVSAAPDSENVRIGF